jgi:hypothetical protein
MIAIIGLCYHKLVYAIINQIAYSQQLVRFKGGVLNEIYGMS